MNIKRILCPIDFSNFSDTACSFASIFAQASGAEIIFLHVARGGLYEENYGYARQRTAKRALARLIRMKPTINGIQFSHDVEVNKFIADTIVRYATKNKCDLIVLSTHGRTGLRRLLLGSVAEAVLRTATCNVATIRSKCDFLNQQPFQQWHGASVPATETKESVP